MDIHQRQGAEDMPWMRQGQLAHSEGGTEKTWTTKGE